jgi:hypothetical protein
LVAIYEKLVKSNGVYSLTIYENETNEILLTMELGYSADTYKPIIADHPLSNKISQRSSNFTGLGLNSPGQFDDYFIYSTQAISFEFKLCMHSVTNINQSSECLDGQ